MGAAAAPRADRPTGCAGVSGFAGYAGSAFAAFLRNRRRRAVRFALTGAERRREYSNIAAQSATGIGLPITQAHQRPSIDARRFFVARHRAGCVLAMFMAGGTRGASAPPVPESGRPTRAVRHPAWSRVGGLQSTQEFCMYYDTQGVSASAAGRFGRHFNLTASALEWNRAASLNMRPSLAGTSKAIHTAASACFPLVAVIVCPSLEPQR